MYDDGIHPLDRDYSVPSKPAKGWFTRLPKWHRIGFATFAAGFATLLFTAIVLGSFPGGGWVERVGSFLHRLSMYIILIGGLIVVAAYQGPRRAAALHEWEQREAERRRVRSRGVPYQDSTFGTLIRHRGDPVVAFTGELIMPSCGSVAIRIERQRGDDGVELPTRELVDQARISFQRIQQNQSSILSMAAQGLAKNQNTDFQTAVDSMDLVWIRFCSDGESELIYDVSQIFNMPWGHRMMHVGVDAQGNIQEGKRGYP